MKISKPLVYCNVIALLVNGMLVWLTVVRLFPAMLGVLLVLAGFAGAIWLSAKANGKRFRLFRRLCWRLHRFYAF